MIKSNNKTKLRHLLLLLNNTNLVFNLSTKLFKLVPNLEALFAKNNDLSSLGLSQDEIIKLRSQPWHTVDKDLLWAEKAGHHIITIDDICYPKLLKEIPNPPLLLFAIGDLALLESLQLAIVGSRNPTPIGVEIATNFAKALAAVGLVITSGFAMGIDAASHRGAVKASGKTIAVMGAGLNHVYPRSNVALAHEIVETGGLLLSEFPLDAEAQSWHFPLRNRIISGLSVGTLVVEAAMHSGSLITARLAGEQGREVFAIPGSIHNPAARGCHYLIRQGAKLVEEPKDILEEFPAFANALPMQDIPSSNAKEKNKLDYKYQKLLDCMGFEIVTLDVLASRINVPVSQVSIMLLELELQGLVKTVLGGYSKL